MKKFFTVFCFAMLMVLLQPTVFVKASSTKTQAANIVSSSIHQLENGDFIAVKLTVSSHHDALSIHAATETISGSKTLEYYDASGKILWSFTLSASYDYNGNNASCTSVSTSSSVHATTWKLSDITKSKSSNKATGSVTAKEYFAGIPFNTVTETLTLTCSATGKLS